MLATLLEVAEGVVAIVVVILIFIGIAAVIRPLVDLIQSLRSQGRNIRAQLISHFRPTPLLPFLSR
jgi:hypothetical protein